MSKQRLTLGQFLKKELIKMAWGLLAALLIGIIAYFSVMIGLKKVIEQVGKPAVTNAVH